MEIDVLPIISSTFRLMADKELKKEVRKLTKHLITLTVVVRNTVNALDAEMKLPSSQERGQRIAKISNYLEYHNDCARHFGLGFPLKKAKK
jgi:hypothetical protein